MRIKVVEPVEHHHCSCSCPGRRQAARVEGQVQGGRRLHTSAKRGGPGIYPADQCDSGTFAAAPDHGWPAAKLEYVSVRLSNVIEK